MKFIITVEQNDSNIFIHSRTKINYNKNNKRNMNEEECRMMRGKKTKCIYVIFVTCKGKHFNS